MNNGNNNEKDVSLSQKTNDENIISKLTLAGLTVHIVRQNDQIIYKLPDNMQVSSIGEEQRQQLMKEIQALHTTMAQQQQQQQQPIAPRTLSSLDAPPEPTAAEATALEETARSLREELEQQQKLQQQYNDGKTTRRYNKTGKYSKKKQLQLQQQMHEQMSQQVGQPSYQQFIQHLQQGSPQQQLESNPSTAINTPISTTPTAAYPFPIKPTLEQPITSTPITTIPTAITQLPKLPDSILSKRLPEEELQHREIKKRFMDALVNDRRAVITPDYEKPFSSVEDAINRLLPYHIYQYPKGDLESNQIPLERQDNTMLEIFKCQAEMFEKHNKMNHETKELQTMVNRQILADQRQKIAEEQARIDAAQRQEAQRVQAEKSRLQQMQFQQIQPQPIQQIVQQLLPHQPLDQTQNVNYANGLAQAIAPLQNPQFINHYSQLSPDLQQKLLQNREQLMALLQKQQQQQQQQQFTPQ